MVWMFWLHRFTCDCPAFTAPLAEEAVFSPLCILSPLSKINWPPCVGLFLSCLLCPTDLCVCFCASAMLFGLPRWLSGKEFACQCSTCRFSRWVGKIPWRREWQRQYSCLGNPMDRGGYRPWGHKRVRHDLATNQQPCCFDYCSTEVLSEVWECSASSLFFFLGWLWQFWVFYVVFVVQSLSHIRLFVTPRTTTCQFSLS